MILVLAGTSEGRKTASMLLTAGYDVLATAVSDYGAQLLRESGVQNILVGPLDNNMLASILANRVRAVVDATHPYAVNITGMALELCYKRQVHYIRLERPSARIPEHPLIMVAPNLEKAMDIALVKNKVLFSTLGSRNLARLMVEARKKSAKLIARVLPEPEVIRECHDIGLLPGQIVAAQGPFSREFNREMFRAYGADMIITKESGCSGGVDTKILAALDLEIPVIIWARPDFSYPCKVESPEEVLWEIKKINRLLPDV